MKVIDAVRQIQKLNNKLHNNPPADSDLYSALHEIFMRAGDSEMESIHFPRRTYNKKTLYTLAKLGFSISVVDDIELDEIFIKVGWETHV